MKILTTKEWQLWREGRGKSNLMSEKKNEMPTGKEKRTAEDDTVIVTGCLVLTQGMCRRQVLCQVGYAKTGKGDS